MRKSHRIIYEYQRRMLDLMFYIRNIYSISNKIAGRKMFSDPIRKTTYYSNEYNEVNLKVNDGMWAWDFIYSYLFEFHFGSTVDKDTGLEYSFSVVQVSDTGYFLSSQNNKSRIDTNSFYDPEESESVLIFVFEAIPLKTSKYYWGIEDSINHLASTDETEEILKRDGKGVYIACKYSIENFIDKDSTDKVLNSFARLIANNTKIKLKSL
ncbi:MAG: hypothetical protein SNH73_00935 [Rikenellaceae bacterium]